MVGVPPKPNFGELQILNDAVRAQLAGEQLEAAQTLATRWHAAALTDMGTLALAQGKYDDALAKYQTALNSDAQNQPAFQNLVAALMSRNQFRGENFASLVRFLRHHEGKQAWTSEYQRLRYLPTFLNVEFVHGKCNLHCRMCVGRNHPEHPNQLTVLSVDKFRQMLDAATTVSGLTLSSGDSEPFLHPQIEQIIEIARERNVKLDFYTNGHPLTEKKARVVVASQTVQMVNFSIDAVNAETYQRIRRDRLDRVLNNVGTLIRLRNELGGQLPIISFSFVAMKDNIAELPAFVELAAKCTARRVLVEDLIGWGQGEGGNELATDHPQCFEFVEQAKRIARQTGVSLQLPERLLESPTGKAADTIAQIAMNLDMPGGVETGVEPVVEEKAKLRCCGWLNGVWVNENGSLDPCCLVHDVADMGNIDDGPLHENDKYAKVKALLETGKVFDKCVGQRQCQYVQQQESAGNTLEVITDEELGELAPGRRLPVIGG